MKNELSTYKIWDKVWNGKVIWTDRNWNLIEIDIDSRFYTWLIQ